MVAFACAGLNLVPAAGVLPGSFATRRALAMIWLMSSTIIVMLTGALVAIYAFNWWRMP
jgi:hypothetical protein